MAYLSSIARPYALAAFEYARDKQQLPAWKAFLKSAAYAAALPQVMELLTHPDIPTNQLFDLFHDILSSQLDTERNNFLMLLAKNKRLIALPEIAYSFNTFYADFEKTSTVRVITAVDVDEHFRLALTQKLTHRIQRKVTLACEIDPSILGGAIIHIGDQVIDGSIRGQLTRLLEFSLR